MSAILLKHEGYDVMTTAWSAASKDEKSVTVCYQWGADWISWIDSATGIRRVTLNMSFGDFWREVRDNQIADLRQWSQP